MEVERHASSDASWGCDPENEPSKIDGEKKGKMIFTFSTLRSFKIQYKNRALNFSHQSRTCRHTKKTNRLVHYRSMKNLKWITWWFKSFLKNFMNDLLKRFSEHKSQHSRTSTWVERNVSNQILKPERLKHSRWSGNSSQLKVLWEAVEREIRRICDVNWGYLES